MGNVTDRDIEVKLVLDEYDMTVPYICLICFNVLLLSPINIYCCYHYYLLRDTYMYNARRPKLVLTVIIISIIYICFYIPLNILIFQLLCNNDNTYNEYWDAEFLFGAQMFVFMSYILRTWHSFYDFKLNYQIAAEKWKSILNEKRYKGTSSIYIKYRERLGSSQWTFKYLLILPVALWFIAFAVIIAFRTGYNVEYYMIGLAFGYLILGLFVSIFIIFRTTRDVYDNIYLRGEILLGCFNIVFAIFGEIAVLLYDIIPGYNVPNDQYQQVYYFVQDSINTVSSFLLIIISTQYIKFKIYQRNKELSKFEEHMQKLTDDQQSHQYKQRKLTASTSVLIDFESLISTADGLQCFLDHLANENQLNYLVFAMEVTQFKKDIITAEIQQMSKMNINSLTLLPFPETIVPESSIVFPQITIEKSYRKMYMELYVKYMDPVNAEWPVQISKEHLNAAIEIMRRCKSRYQRQKTVTSAADETRYCNKCCLCSCFTPTSPSSEQMFKESLLNDYDDYGDQKDQLQEYLDILDDALTDSIKILTTSFEKFKETQQFETWLHKLTTTSKLEMLDQFNKRKSVKETLQKIENNKIVKQWICNQCTLKNRTIYVGNKEYPPKNYCKCCGYNNPLYQESSLKSEMEMKVMKQMEHNYHDEFIIDENINEQWNGIKHNDAYDCDNKSIKNCARIQRLLIIVKFYETHKNTETSQTTMTDFIHNLNRSKEYDLTKLMEDYEHISSKHFESFLFELFTKEVGSCFDGGNCDKMMRNRRNRDRNSNSIITDSDRERSVSNSNINTFINKEEKQYIEYLNKIHLFLFHSEIDEKYDYESDLVLVNSNKFMTDASKYGNDSKNNESEKTNSNYEYGFGSHLQYHTLSPLSYFICMKDELTGNEIYKITEEEWDDTLNQALQFQKAEFVEENYIANDHGLGHKYGIKEGDLIGIDNIIAILLYCNFDDFQREFSNTFRKLNDKNDHDNNVSYTKQYIINRHCYNFYWYGRSLYVAINYFGKRMNKTDTVWHGLSSKMVFKNFATYFDSPTSTTTDLLVAQRFSNNGNGIILKLQSKYQNNCSFMLDVSPFSDYTNESERLFLNESLLITDILHINDEQNEWISNKIYILALVFFNKITTGMANDNDWNILENENIQNILSDIIDDYFIRIESNDNNKNNIPNYIQLLFKHYCTNNYLPRFNNIHKIHNKMTKRLKMYLFDLLFFNEEELLNNKQKISQVKIKLLFPNAMSYVNDQGNEIIITTTQGN